MNPQVSSVIPTVLSALGNEGRLRILEVILDRGGEMSSGEIAQQFSTAWSTTTRHLAVLREAGLVTVDKRGRERIYAVQPGRVEQTFDLVRTVLSRSKESPQMDPATNDLTLDSAMLYVKSVSESVTFYEKLGFLLSDQVEGVSMVSAPGGGHLKLHPAPDVGTTVSEGINLYFRVGDIDAHYEVASDAGIDFDFPPTTMSWGDRHSYVTDPDGHTISFVLATP